MFSKVLLYLLTAIGIGVLFVAYQLLRPVTLITVNSITVSPSVVTKATKSIQIKSDTCTHYSSPDVIEIYLAQVGGAIKIAKVDGHLSLGCKITASPVPLSLIPDYIQNGDYTFRFIVTAQVSPLKSTTQVINSSIFTLNR